MLKRTMTPGFGVLSLLAHCLAITGLTITGLTITGLTITRTANAQTYEGIETCYSYHLLRKAGGTVRIGVDRPGERMRPERPDDFLGAHLLELTPESRLRLGLPEDLGVLVVRVVPESPAARAGVQAGDVLTRIDGEEVDSRRAVRRILRRATGDSLPIELWRDGEVVTSTVTVGAEGQAGI